MHIFLSRALVALSTSAILALAATAGVPEAKVLSIPEGAIDYALNPDTGAFAAVYPKDDKVVFFPKLASEGDVKTTKSVDVGKTPIAVTFKRLAKSSVFVVASEKDVAIFDGDTLELSKTVPTNFEQITSLSASSDPMDSFVYIFGSTAEQEIAAGAVDLDTFDVIRGRTEFGAGLVSGDGTKLYCLAGSFEILKSIPNKTFAIKAIKNHYGTGNAFFRPGVADPFGRYVVIWQKVWDPGQLNKLATLSITPQFCSAKRPVMLGLNNDRLTAVSSNTFQEIGSTASTVAAAVQTAFKNGADPHSPITPQRRIFDHPARDSVLVCFGPRVEIVPYATLKLPDEPNLVARVVGTRNFVEGRPNSIQIAAADPAVNVAIAEAPEGVKLDGDRLTWTPASPQAGSHVVTLKLSAKGTEKSMAVPLQVRRAAIEAPFPIAKCSPSSDGSKYLILGGKTEDGRPAEKSDSIAIVDLPSMSVTAHAKFAAPATEGAIDKHFAYAATAADDAICAYSLKDLSEVKRVAVRGKVHQILPIDDRFLLVTLGFRQGPTLVVKVPELEVARPEDVGLPSNDPISNGDTGPSPRVGDGWLIHGIYFDDAMKSVRAVVRPRHFWSFCPNDKYVALPCNLPEFDRSSHQWQWLAPWGLSQESRGFTLGSRRLDVRNYQDDPRVPPAALVDVPGYVALLGPSGPNSNAPRGPQRQLVFHDLITNTARVRIPLGDGIDFPQTANEETARIDVRPGKLVVLHANVFHVVPMPDLPAQDFPAPLTFEPKLSVEVLNTKDLRVSLPVPQPRAGKKPDVTFRLRQPTPGCEIDGDHVKIDAARIVASAKASLVHHLGRAKEPFIEHVIPPPQTVLEKYLKDTTPIFERLVGRKPNGIPVWLTVPVVAADDSKESVAINRGLFVEIPSDGILPQANFVRALNEDDPVAFAVLDVAQFARSLVSRAESLQRALQRMMQEKKWKE